MAGVEYRSSAMKSASWPGARLPIRPPALRLLAEPAVAARDSGVHLQFERSGYYFADPVDSTPGRPSPVAS